MQASCQRTSESKGKIFMRIAYFVMVYKILLELLLTVNQLGIHLQHTVYERTNNLQGNDISIIGRSNKCQITCLVSCLAIGTLVPPQVIFEGVIHCGLEPRGLAAAFLRRSGWNLTHSKSN